VWDREARGEREEGSGIIERGGGVRGEGEERGAEAGGPLGYSKRRAGELSNALIILL